MAVEHVFAPKGVALGDLPLPKPGTTVFPTGSGWSQFLRGDMPQIPGRNRVVDDNGWHVWECEAHGNDAGTVRNEAWRGDTVEQGVYYAGETFGFAFGVNIPAAFPYLPGWGLLFQVHPGWTSSVGNPMTTLSFGGTKGLRWQNDSSGEVFYSTPWEYGKYHYFVCEIKLGNPDGHMTLWHAADRLPDPAVDAPVYDKQRATCPPDPPDRIKAYTKSGIYMAGSASGASFVHRRDGYAEAASAVRAHQLYKEICNPAAVGVPPPPADTLPLTIISQDTNSVIVGWTPPAAAAGYRFRKDGGKWSHTWDGSRSTVKFGKPYVRLEVEALVVLAKGDLP